MDSLSLSLPQSPVDGGDIHAPILHRASRIIELEDDKPSEIENEDRLSSPLKRFPSLKIIPRVFKSKRSNSTNNHTTLQRAPATPATPSTLPSGHHRSRSDFFPKSERPVITFTVHPPDYEDDMDSLGLGTTSEVVVVSGQPSEQESDDLLSVSTHLSSGQSFTNSSGLESADDSFEEVTVPELLLHGTPLLKVSAKKVEALPIEAIKEIRAGEATRSHRVQLRIAADAEPRWLTLVYLADGKYKTLNVVAPSIDVFHMWVDTVSKLWKLRRELASMSEGKTIGDPARDVLRKEKVWERLYWKTSDEAGEERLEWKEVKKLCLRLNIHAPEADLLRKFKEADVYNQGFLNFTDFQRFVKLLKARPEIQRLYNMVRAGGELNFHKFTLFMRNHQKCTLSDPELERIFNNFALIPQSPSLSPRNPLPDLPSNSNESPETLQSPSTPTSTMSLSGFTSFLQSAENAPFKDTPHDMTRPLSEYYISSSHNTYLVGHQLVGSSTTEGYIRALLQGCRSVELDIFDGETEPMIFHGKTLTTKVSLREVCIAIAKYAFHASPYPIIISAEVHCSVTQQDMIAEIMKETFGDALVTKRLEEISDKETLPSPEQLKGRVLLKAKNLNLLVNTAGEIKETKNVYDVTSESSTDEWDAAKAERMVKVEAKELKSEIEQSLNRARNVLQRVRGVSVSPPQLMKPLPALPQETPKSKAKMSLSLAELLVYTIGVKCRGLNKKEQYAIEHVFSLSEKTANKMLKQSMMDLIKHTRTHVIRVYPKGLRLNSSNYEPHRYWAAGAQLVALNWQTFDLGYMMNHAMFHQNGRTGYVLKPPPLRNGDKAHLMQRGEHFLDVTIISAQQLPRARDKEGREVLNKHIVDPYVEISLFIPDWTHSPFQHGEHHIHFPHLHHDPSRSASAPVQSSIGSPLSPSSLAPPTTIISSSSARTVIARTGVVKNNGFNPVWEESLSLPFDCVGGMHELVFVKITVKQENGGDDDTPIAVYCSSLGSLQQGYRHLPLHDQQLSQYLFSTLFVRVQIRDVFLHPMINARTI
ncbi:hypothetical protein Clacol_008933 [Clathrus columnatus]|uniref:Phosphoinositide phospholipase C n=1 Tax=Clathrus columnatus TaxID=1419009 RepID=A0AAV5ALV5_9AGAM|nr:hypothetical protein Clacol_008933 [Clathrus columnatus]